MTPHTCPSDLICPICKSVPIGYRPSKLRLSDEYVLALMVEDGLVEAADLEPKELPGGRYQVAA